MFGYSAHMVLRCLFKYGCFAKQKFSEVKIITINVPWFEHIKKMFHKIRLRVTGILCRSHLQLTVLIESRSSYHDAVPIYFALFGQLRFRIRSKPEMNLLRGEFDRPEWHLLTAGIYNETYKNCKLTYGHVNITYFFFIYHLFIFILHL